MADRLVAHSPMAEVETRLGVKPIEELLDERSHLVERVADLRARYGSFGTFDHIRKIELSRIEGLLRAEHRRDKVRMTIPEMSAATHSHPDYTDFIIQATRDRAEYVKVEAKIEAIDATIQRANAIVRYLTSEARL